jgi:thioredoxin 1
MAQAVTESTFEREVLRADKPVIVDFWAEWCGPCHAVSPVLDRIAEERGELKLVRVNVDEEVELQRRYGVVSIPTIMLFRDGRPERSTVGAHPKASLERLLGLAAQASGSVGLARPQARSRSQTPATAAAASSGARSPRS